MGDSEMYTIDQAHEFFAKRINREAWELLEKPDRTLAENERMVAAAYASTYHWLHAGDEVNQQRGEWLLSRVYTLLGNAHMALAHAKRCMDWTTAYEDKMADFDVAYALEGLARAYALMGDRESARKFRDLAEEAGREIADPEDKKIFMDDLTAGEWHQS